MAFHYGEEGSNQRLPTTQPNPASLDSIQLCVLIGNTLLLFVARTRQEHSSNPSSTFIK